jgi:hypothetical protein
LAGEFIDLILGNDSKETKEKSIDIEISTQVKFDKGRSIPDLVIRNANAWTLCIEIKLWADEGEGQIRKYLGLGVFNALSFITAASVGYTIEKCVLDDPVYRKPTGRDHFVWEDVYSIVEKAAKTPGSHPVVLAMLGLFDELCLAPAPPIEGLFPPKKYAKEQRRKLYKLFWAPTEERLERGGWGKFVIHTHPNDMAQMYVTTCPHPHFNMFLLEFGTKLVGTSFVRATVTLNTNCELVSFYNTLKEMLYDKLPITEIYHNH